MIVVDSSAVVAMLFEEDVAAALVGRLSEDGDRLISAASFVEAGTVLAGRRLRDREKAVGELGHFLSDALIVVAPVDRELARLALMARIRFGKGMGHPAQLNFGDSFSYALAKRHEAPLLFVGDDFSKTDILPALLAH